MKRRIYDKNKKTIRKIRAFQAIFKAGTTKIGIELQPKKNGGMIIKNVIKNSQAEKQGLRKGCSLLKIDDEIVLSSDTVEMVDRKKRLQKGRAKIKQREEEEKQDRLEANAMAMER